MAKTIGEIQSDSIASYDYVWIDATARNAQAGMAAGENGYQRDTKTLYEYDGTNWIADAGVDLSNYSSYDYVVADAAARNALTGMTVGETIFQTDTGEVYTADSATTTVAPSSGGVETTPNTDPNATYTDGQLYTGKTGLTYMYSSNADGLGNAGWIMIGELMRSNKVNKKRIVANSTYHTLFLLSDGTVKSVGYNNNGQLGNGNTTNQTTPVVVTGVTNCIGVAAGDNHSLFLINDGTVMSCGLNSNGQLGDSSTTQRTTAVLMSGTGSGLGEKNVIDIDAGSTVSIVLLSGGSVWTCGQHTSMLNDPGSDQNFLYKATGTFKGITAGGTKSYGLLQSGGIVGSTGLDYSSIGGVSDIDAGYDFCLFLYEDGSVSGIGENSYGQLGNGSTSDKTVETPIIIEKCISIHAGSRHSMFILEDGTVRSCGLNTSKQLGNGTTTNSDKPILATNIGKAENIALGADVSFILGNDGTLKSLGRNIYGQFGDGTTNDSATLVNISGITLLTDPNITDPNNLI